MIISRTIVHLATCIAVGILAEKGIELGAKKAIKKVQEQKKEDKKTD